MYYQKRAVKGRRIIVCVYGRCVGFGLCFIVSSTIWPLSGYVEPSGYRHTDNILLRLRFVTRAQW